MIGIFKASLKKYSVKYSRFGVLYILLAAVAAVVNIIVIQATGNMTYAAELGVTGDMMNFLLILAIAGAVQTLAGGIMALVEKRFLGRVIHTIRLTFARLLLEMPYKGFSAKNSGEGASLFTGDVPKAATFLTTQVLSQISQLTTLVVSIVFMAFINWWLTLAYFALFPVLAILQAKLAVPIGKKREEASKRRAEYNAVVSDALQNPLTVMAYGLEASVERRFGNSYSAFYDAEYSAAKTTASLALFGVFATILPTLALFFAACAVVIEGDMTIAGFIALTIISGPVGSWLTMFAQEMARLQTSSASAIRVLDFLPDTTDSDTSVVTADPEAAFAVHFENVTFGYNEEAVVFDNLTLTIEKGGVTAIAGPSGFGKSTVLKLILGLYKPDGGEISLSTENLAYVPQDCYLLPVSIRENLLGGLPPDEERLTAACEKAGILSFIQGLPDGFNSVLAESAANVSGGQKQRLAMARAFYRNADVLLLDEATSALDPETERSVLEAFDRYVKSNGKTAVVVAHRQSVLDMADRIITLEEEGAR